MTEIFKFCDNTTHNLRSGVESISTLGTKIWTLVPENLR